MKISELKQTLPALFRSNIAALLWGNAGIGKTEGVGQVAQENNMEFITLNLGTQEVGDLLGLPDFKNGKTVHRLPEWFPTDPDSKGILFLDEINRAQRYVLQAIFSLVLEKRLNTHYLPKGWVIVAAANPYNEDYVVTDIGDEAFMSRFCHLKVNNDVEEWSRYATGVGVPNVVTSFALEQRGIFQDKTFNLPKFSPRYRSLNALGRLVAEGSLSEQLMFEVTMGIMGTEAGVAFMKHMKEYQSSIRGLDVLKHWDKVKAKVTELSDSNNPSASRLDVLNSTNTEIFTELAKMEKVSKKVKDNLHQYLITIPKDLSVSVAMRLLDEDATRDLVANEDILVDYYEKSMNKQELKQLVEKDKKVAA